MTQNLARSCRNTRQSYVTLSGLGRSSHLQLNIFSFPHREYRDVMAVGGNYRNYIPHSVNHSTVVMLGGQMDTQQGRCWRLSPFLSGNKTTQKSPIPAQTLICPVCKPEDPVVLINTSRLSSYHLVLCSLYPDFHPLALGLLSSHLRKNDQVECNQIK